MDDEEQGIDALEPHAPLATPRRPTRHPGSATVTQTKPRRPNPRPDMNFTPVRNGMDYLISAVKNLTEGSSPPSDRDLKYAVLHLQAATEVLLKARLVREHWSLVFKDPGSADRAVFETGRFESCNIAATIHRLEKIAQVAISEDEQKAIRGLADTRNALTHYGHTANAYAVEAQAAEVLGFLLTFISRQLHPVLSSEGRGVAETMNVLRMKLSGIETLVKKRMNQLSGELAPLAKRTVTCPDCRQWALVVGGDREGTLVISDALLTCRFCLQEWTDLAQAASEYAWIVFGEDDFFGARNCGDCGSKGGFVRAFIADEKTREKFICFECGSVRMAGRATQHSRRVTTHD
ncbi:hypothetical protein QFZ24_005422 [Streptomyces phaeochromogenes]|uniref:hypothetical protein n=1 Tax=Streptomyces phaeochromogenes TaxID=1923 RepID=UPI00278E39F6|nr:hypothetical protein [Streptomyces phaeochromogenes]MDQ0951499.1 hypothetical protein [Streptomyces phaeochromogenes]